MAEGKDAGEGETGHGLDDEDRLPWLEAADGFEEEGEVSPVRLLVMVLGGLLLIGAVLGGLWWIQNGGARGNGELIAAQRGDYKVAPANDGARTSQGEGDGKRGVWGKGGSGRVGVGGARSHDKNDKNMTTRI